MYDWKLSERASASAPLYAAASAAPTSRNLAETTCPELNTNSRLPSSAAISISSSASTWPCWRCAVPPRAALARLIIVVELHVALRLRLRVVGRGVGHRARRARTLAGQRLRRDGHLAADGFPKCRV